MKITVEEKAEIKELLLTDRRMGIQRLFKLKNSNLDEIQDIFWVTFTLSLMYKKEENFEISKFYIDELMVIMEDANESLRYEKALTLWLYIELNNKLTKDELLKIYSTIYENIKFLGDDNEKVLGVVGNIHMLNNEYDEVLNIFNICLKRQYIETVDSILDDFKKKNEIYYAKAMYIKSNYNKSKMVN